MKRVLVYSPLQLVGESVVSLLRGSDGIDVVGCETDPERAMQLSRESKPDVIVISSDSPTGIPSPLVLGLWQSGCRAKIIELDLSGRSLAVYQADQAIVTDPLDLVRAILQPLAEVGPRETSLYNGSAPQGAVMPV